jgi:hypothetical protein
MQMSILELPLEVISKYIVGRYISADETLALCMSCKRYMAEWRCQWASLVTWVCDENDLMRMRFAISKRATTIKYPKWAKPVKEIGGIPLFCDLFCRDGDIASIRWLLARGGHKKFSTIGVGIACTYGHLEVVKCLVAANADICTRNCLSCAIQREGTEVLCWLLEDMRERWTQEDVNRSMETAAIRGNVEAMILLRTSGGHGFCQSTIFTTAAKGHVAVLRWICMNNLGGDLVCLETIYTSYTLREALRTSAAHGHLDTVIFLCDECHYHGEINIDVIMAAAKASVTHKVLSYLLGSRMRRDGVFDFLTWTIHNINGNIELFTDTDFMMSLEHSHPGILAMISENIPVATKILQKALEMSNFAFASLLFSRATCSTNMNECVFNAMDNILKNNKGIIGHKCVSILDFAKCDASYNIALTKILHEWLLENDDHVISMNVTLSGS